MKTIKIKFIGFWDGYNPSDSIIFKLLSNDYIFEITDKPDYVICGCFEPYYTYLKYPQVRIMICGENYIPDFNFIDYAIQRYPISFLDRSFYEPGCLRPFPECMELEKLQPVDKNILKKKTIFCSFVTSHESEYGARGDFFKKLCEYKNVSSVGSYLNNTGIHVNRMDGTKLEFNKKCKFAICFESTKHEGFLTEKMNDAFLARAIPIYYGSSSCVEIYNPNSFINVSDFKSFDDAIEYIKKVDEDDELCLKMLNEPIFKEDNYLTKLIDNEITFFKHIFDQPIKYAYRRSRVYIPLWYERYILKLKKRNPYNSIFKRIRKKIKQLVHY